MHQMLHQGQQQTQLTACTEILLLPFRDNVLTYYPFLLLVWNVSLALQSDRNGSNAQQFGGYASFANDERPFSRTHEGILQHAHRAARQLIDHGKIDTERTKGVTGTSPLFDLTYFDLALHTLLDSMHIVSGVVGRHLVPMLVGGRIAAGVVALKKNFDRRVEAERKRVEVRDKRIADENAKINGWERQRARKKNGSTAFDALSDKISAAKTRLDQLEGRVAANPEDGSGDEADDADAWAHGERARSAADIDRMANFLKLWSMPKAVAERIDAIAYRKIVAPDGIAPDKRGPLSRPGEMNSHHWFNFTKVYGKYLFSAYYSGDHLRVLCELLDFIKACLGSHLSPQDKDDIHAKAKQVASNFDQFFPPTEQSLMLHVLVFHMPQTLALFGPARGYHCFPFERYAHKGRELPARA